MVVTPKESPKVAGLRSDTGPCRAPPGTSHAAPCARPTTISAHPVRQANRCAGPAWSHSAASEARILPGSDAEATGAFIALTSARPARRRRVPDAGHQPHRILVCGKGDAVTSCLRSDPPPGTCCW
jgi:hypothetical protein